MKVETVMVTGANSGIGLEFVRQLSRLSEPPKYIFASYSSDSLKDLQEIEESSTKSKIILIKMGSIQESFGKTTALVLSRMLTQTIQPTTVSDVTNLEEREAAKNVVEETVKERGLNLLINNAGVRENQALPHLTAENLELHFRVNTVGPIMVFQTMLPLLEKAANLQSDTGSLSVSRSAVLNITSMTGSCTLAGVVFTRDLVMPAYKISKAALNMAMRVIATNVKAKGIFVINMCPGWVKTNLGTEKAVLEPEESIWTIINTLPKLNESHHGTFIDRKGNPYPY